MCAMPAKKVVPGEAVASSVAFTDHVATVVCVSVCIAAVNRPVRVDV